MRLQLPAVDYSTPDFLHAVAQGGPTALILAVAVILGFKLANRSMDIRAASDERFAAALEKLSDEFSTLRQEIANVLKGKT